MILMCANDQGPIVVSIFGDAVAVGIAIQIRQSGP